jgi:glycosyltransferase involved in cell wall biosynthesis
MTIALFQPIVPHYHLAVFNEINKQCNNTLVVFAGMPVGRSGYIDGSSGLEADFRHSRTYRIGPLWCVPAAFRQVAFGGHSVVVLSWNARQIELTPVLLLGRILRVPVVLWGHGMGRSSSRAARLLRSVQARLAKVVITYSDGGRRDVQASAPAANVVVAPNTTGRIADVMLDPLRPPSRRVAYVGRMTQAKRIDRLFAAIALLNASGCSIGIDLIGDGEERSALERLAVDLGLGLNVAWHGTVSDWPALQSLLQSADAVVFPEAAGLGVVDAMAAGRPSIVCGLSHTNGPEVCNIIDGVTGLTYRVPTAEGLALAIMRLYEDPDTLRKLSEGASRHYATELSLEKAVLPFVDTFRCLTATKRSIVSVGAQP